MDQLKTFLDSLSKRLYQEDSVDRLNYHYTVWLLLAFALTLSAKQYVGEPIQCWVPAEFTGGWEQYTENYCFIENTYFVPVGQNLPEAPGDRKEREIAYYQWVPFVLALQALMFYFPHIVWRLLNWQSGIYLRGVITMAVDQSVKHDTSVVDEIAVHLKSVVDQRQKNRSFSSGGALGQTLQCGRSSGSYLTGTYLLVKLLFIINLIAQFFILNSFLGTDYAFWGASILHDIIREKDWQVSGHFPRVTFCDFVVRTLGGQRQYSVQCVLMINMFSEKIFLFIWWWFLVVVCVTIVNFFYWLLASLSASSRRNYLERLMGTTLDHPAPGTDPFDQYLQPDVVLVLRLMANNAGEMVTGRVCKSLYKLYQERDGKHTVRMIKSAIEPGPDTEKMPLTTV